nr:glycosyltransferase family 1 protein [Bacteroidales bacterium]
MKIAVNMRLVVKGRMDGIGWFSWETMTRMARRHPDHHFLFFFDRKPNPAFILPDNATSVVIPPVTRLPFLLTWWHTTTIPAAIRKHRPDLYISPDCFLPDKPAIPSIVVIHDLNFEHFPDFIPGRYRSIYRNRVRKSAKVATRVATVSEFSRDDIISTYGVEPSRIDVIYSGLNSFFTPVSDHETHQIRQKFNTGDQYFLVSGTIHPRKNAGTVIEAFIRFREKHPAPFKLVFAGRVKTELMSDLVGSLRDTPFYQDVIFTGRVEDAEMNGLYRGAAALVFASLYEGFGLPLLEAAIAGIPAITSAGSALAEIGGRSSLLVDPGNPQEIADAMHMLIRNPDLAGELVVKSKVLPETYTWDRTADLLWQGVEKALGNL